jgi:type VI secretion system protein ImpG
MRDELLGYYERELTFLRHMGAQFATKYPKIASRLEIESEKCEDPHVERMVEAFSFLAARIQLKLDDEFPEVTESFLNILYPHYLAPFPSTSIAQFTLDTKEGGVTSGYKIDKGTTLYSRPVNGTPCRFQTCYPVTLWPLEIASTTLDSLDPVNTKGKWSNAVLRINLHCNNQTSLGSISVEDTLHLGRSRPIDSLRFYINSEGYLAYSLYEMIFNNCTGIEVVSADGRKVNLSTSSIVPVGFEEDEGLLPFSARSFSGYRLLSEMFVFPEKFLFFDIKGLDQAARSIQAEDFQINLYFRDITPPRAPINSSILQLGCTPIINLFRKIAEPIHLSHQNHEYHVIPDVHRQMSTEIYSIDSVTTTDPYLHKSKTFQPFYSVHHSTSSLDQETYWYATRKASGRPEDSGTEIYITLVDLGFNPKVPAEETITVHTTCTNRDLPSKLPFGGRDGDMEIEGQAPLSRIRCLKKPTETVRPPLRRAAQWRLISHLSLNHISLVNGNGGDSPEALQEILMLYNFQDSPALRKMITGITRVSTRKVVRQTGSKIGTGFVRGLETTIEFDEENFVGSGVYLFASVLERFLGLYVSMNSFVEMVARSKQREGLIRRWKPRSGQQILL